MEIRQSDLLLDQGQALLIASMVVCHWLSDKVHWTRVTVNLEVHDPYDLANAVQKISEQSIQRFHLL